MKEGIHPKYEQTTIRCACGEVIETGSTKKDIKVEICSKCQMCIRDSTMATQSSSAQSMRRTAPVSA